MSDEKTDAKDLSIRQNLVDTAVSFLLNPNVKKRQDDAKIAFLKKKGLTDSEITNAFDRIKYDSEANVVSYEDRSVVNAYPIPPHPKQNSFWFQLRSYSSAFVSFAVSAYVLHHIYKAYIEPWLFSSKSEKSDFDILTQQLKELNNSVSRLSTTVASLEEAVNNQMHEMDRSSLYGVESVPKSVRDILEEVSNVKGLLLNRFSFPAPPSITGPSTENKAATELTPKVVSIPRWQLCDSELGKSKEQIEENEDKENQTNNINVTESKVQDEDSNTVMADKNGNSEVNLCLNDKIQDNGEKLLDEDSGVESQNYVSDNSIDGIGNP